MHGDAQQGVLRHGDSPVQAYDNVVLGAGRAGRSLAMAFASAGQPTALVEEGRGGDAGAPPSRTLLASAQVARVARRAREFGVETGTVAVDLARAQRRRHAVMERAPGELAPGDHAPNLTRIEGAVRFTGERTLEVACADGRMLALRAGRIFINSGVRAEVPALPGLDRVPWLDVAAAIELNELPRHLLVVGAGAAALELGQMFCRFGARVSIVDPNERLLPEEDRDVAATVAQVLREDGIGVFLETAAIAVEGDAGGVRLQVRNPAGSRTLSGSHLLMVGDPVPNTRNMNLEAAGVALDERGYVRVDERLETSAAGIYALGDVTGGPAFEHVAQDDLRIVRANLLENSRATTAGRMCPCTVFIDPPLGRVGLTEMEARRQGRDVRVARLPMRRVARAVQLGESRGFIKVVLDAASGRILGAAVIGVGGGEVMAMLQIAMMARMPYTSLRDGVFAHPTLAESLNKLFTSMETANADTEKAT